MKTIIPLLLVVLFAGILSAQTENSNSFEHGLVLCPRLDSDEDLKFKIKGFGLEGGYFFAKRISKRGELSIDFRLVYSSSSRRYERVVNINEFSIGIDSIAFLRTGVVSYRNFSLAMPIKYRFYLGKPGPVFLLAGYSPYFNLVNDSKWRFEEIEYDTENNITLSVKKDQKEELVQKIFSSEVFAGFGYKKDKLRFEFIFSAGSTNFDNDYINAAGRFSMMLNFYHRL